MTSPNHRAMRRGPRDVRVALEAHPVAETPDVRGPGVGVRAGARQLPEGVELLPGQILRRIPTRVELATRRPISLTGRDADILVAVYQHGLLSTELIELAFFPPSLGGRNTSSTNGYERLRQLWLWRLLERLEPPVARKLGGSASYLYAIGSRGVPWVAQRLAQRAEDDGSPVQRRRLDRLNPQFLEHDLIAARLWASVAALVRGAPVLRWRWVGERELRARRLRVQVPGSRRSLAFLPDAYFEIAYVEGQRPGTAAATTPKAETMQCCLVEVDMGSLTLSRFRRKVRAFELALETGLFEREWGHERFEVLVVTRSERRLRHLMRAAGAEVPEDRRVWYSFATVEVLQQRNFGGAGWLTLDGEWVGLLYDQPTADAP